MAAGSGDMLEEARSRDRLAEISKASSGYAEYALKAECVGKAPFGNYLPTHLHLKELYRGRD